MRPQRIAEALIEFEVDHWACRLWIGRPLSSPDLPHEAAQDARVLFRTHLDSTPRPTAGSLADFMADHVPAANAAQVTDLDTRRGVVVYPDWP